mmetsp:Transcript_96460/g.311472  ORF Transcript_96460/g.311472 Transcript_96460/m.311472 type:complete len:400 (+) Transcript_96460:711-1910(+)
MQCPGKVDQAEDADDAEHTEDAVHAEEARFLGHVVLAVAAGHLLPDAFEDEAHEADDDEDEVEKVPALLEVVAPERHKLHEELQREDAHEEDLGKPDPERLVLGLAEVHLLNQDVAGVQHDHHHHEGAEVLRPDQPLQPTPAVLRTERFPHALGDGPRPSTAGSVAVALELIRDPREAAAVPGSLPRGILCGPIDHRLGLRHLVDQRQPLPEVPKVGELRVRRVQAQPDAVQQDLGVPRARHELARIDEAPVLGAHEQEERLVHRVDHDVLRRILPGRLYQALIVARVVQRWHIQELGLARWDAAPRRPGLEQLANELFWVSHILLWLPDLEPAVLLPQLHGLHDVAHVLFGRVQDLVDGLVDDDRVDPGVLQALHLGVKAQEHVLLGLGRVRDAKPPH